MDDLIKGIKAQLYDRLSSPLLFTFLFSFVAWNYRAALIFLSSLTPSDKFLALDLLSLTWDKDQLYWFCHLFLFPLLTSALYIFALPWAEKFVFEYTLMRKKELKIARQKIEDETPISNEEARELRSLAETVNKEYDSIIKSRQEEIARLKLEVSDLKELLKLPRETLTTDGGKEVSLSTSQEQMLRKISDLGGVDISKYILFKEWPDSARVKIQYDIDELARGKLINEHTATDDDGEHTYDAVSVTPDGRKFLIEKLSVDLA